MTMTVSRHTIVAALEEIARYLDLDSGNQFRATAYQRAAKGLEKASGDLAAIAAANELTSIPGIGKGIAPVIAEIIETGRSGYLEKLRAEYPAGVFELLRVPNLGLKKIERLHQELGITNVAELEAACRDQRLQKLKGFGKKTEEQVVAGIASMSQRPVRWLLPKGLGAAQRLLHFLAEIPSVTRSEISGELRRRLETFGQIDLCLASKKKSLVEKSILALDVLSNQSVEGREVRAFYREFPVVFTIVPPDDFERSKFETTGSEQFVAWAREEARTKGLELEAMADEEEIFETLGVSFIEPELRESPPEKKLPSRLVERDDLRGTFHIHTTYSDGKASLPEMLDAARQRGLTYVGISDHSKTAGYAGGLTEARVQQQQKEIERLRADFPELTIFRGSEVDILSDGSLDYETPTLSSFDFTVISIHSRFKMEKDEMTERMCAALRNPFSTFLGHMTGRLLLSRAGYSLEYDKVFETAGKHGVMIEINGNPNRLDIDWRLMRRALDRGVLFSIHPDAHSTAEYEHLISGVWQARKGALEPKHIFNTLGVEGVREYLEKRRARAIAVSR